MLNSDQESPNVENSILSIVIHNADANLLRNIDHFPIEKKAIEELKQIFDSLNEDDSVSNYKVIFENLTRNANYQSHDIDTEEFHLAKRKYIIFLNALSKKLNQKNNEIDALYNLDFIEYYLELTKNEHSEKGFFLIYLPKELETELQTIKSHDMKNEPIKTLIEIYLTDILGKLVNANIPSKGKKNEYIEKLLLLITFITNNIRERVLSHLKQNNSLNLALLNQICLNIMTIQFNILKNPNVATVYAEKLLFSREDVIEIVAFVRIITLNFSRVSKNNISELHQNMRPIPISIYNRKKPKIATIDESLYPPKILIDLKIVYDPTYYSIPDLIKLMNIILKVSYSFN